MKYACRLTALARYLRLCGEQAQGSVKAGGIGGSKQLELAVVRSDYA
jgi:hypothetical protein